MAWNDDQEWERKWHGNCVNSLNEELKQLVYAKKMGLKFESNGKTPYNIFLNDKSIIDIGGGAYSLLLKCSNFKKALVIDPCNYPDWIYQRYALSYITSGKMKGEDFVCEDVFDETWIYNCLQHTENPEKVIINAKKYSKIIRIFEWIENGISVGHPTNLTENDLNNWLEGIGRVEDINESGCVGKCYYGIFKGDNYGK